jgi:hypothetical protein
MTTNTTKAPKMTKRDYYNAILSKYPLTVDEQKFINHELELLEKKNSSDKKPTAVQTANMALQTAILDHMEKDKGYTISALIKTVPECAELSNQKVSALVRLLVDDGKVEKRVEKRVSLFYRV